MTRKTSENQDSNANEQMPQAVELEKAVLGTLMIENNAYWSISDILHPNIFYDCCHKSIYMAMKRLGKQDSQIDPLLVQEQLKRMNELEKVGGKQYIDELIKKAVPISKIEYYAHILQQKYKSRQLITLASQIRIKANDETTNIEEYISLIKKELSQIASPTTTKGYTQINPLIEEAYHFIQKTAVKADGISGLKTGFTKLDKMTSGWQNGDLITIGARPAMGKTAFIISMLKNMAVEFKKPVALFSLEMTETQLVNRFISNTCDIPNVKILSGQLASYEWQQIDGKLKDLSDAPLYIDCTSITRIDDLCVKCYHLVKDHGVKLIAIDYIQLLYCNIRYTDNSRYLELNYFTRRLKSLAKELQIPIIVLSQLNRNLESREGYEGKRPQLIDLRDSGTLCDDSDIVIFIHRPDYFKMFQDDEGNDLRGMAEIIIAKHRNGALGSLLLRFKGEYNQFSNPDDDINRQKCDEENNSFKSKMQDCDNPFGSNGPLPF